MSAPQPMRFFAVLGDPIAHSLSPRMHSAAIGAAGLEARYVALRTSGEAFPALVRELLANGGGCNVTTPFKDAAFALEGEHSDVARRTRAVNSIWGDPDRPQLDNTDVAGIRRVVDDLEDAPLRSVRLFGTGGAARAAAVAVTDAYPGVLVRVVSRDPARVAGFVRWAAAAEVRCEIAPPIFAEGEDLYINATPELTTLPMRPEDDPHDPAYHYPVPGAYLDLNYRSVGVPLVQYFHDTRDVPSVDGRDVLLYQGVESFERFFGVPAPVHVMRAAVEYALRP